MREELGQRPRFLITAYFSTLKTVRCAVDVAKRPLMALPPVTPTAASWRSPSVPADRVRAATGRLDPIRRTVAMTALCAFPPKT
jgi:hypothetical protein